MTKPVSFARYCFSALFVSAMCFQPIMASAQSDIVAELPKAKDATQQSITAEEVIANYREKVRITRSRCPERTSADEIIVCAEDDSIYRVPPDTRGRLAEGGPPPAPDVAGPGIFKGPATFVREPDRIFHCTTQRDDPPCAYEPDYLIDFSELPEFDEEYAAKARAAAAAERQRQEARESNDAAPE